MNMKNFQIETSKRRAFLFFGMIAMIPVCLVFMMALENEMYAKPAILYLAPQGCAFAKSLGMKTSGTPGGCSVVARHSPGMFGDAGTILLDDDRRIHLMPGIILGTASTDAAMPDTPSQRRARKEFFAVFGFLAIVILSLLRMVFGSRSHD